MDKREKRAVNDMGTAMRRIVDVLERHGHMKCGAGISNRDRADSMIFTVGKALLAVARIRRLEDNTSNEKENI